jgi:hypothetical protein
VKKIIIVGAGDTARLELESLLPKNEIEFVDTLVICKKDVPVFGAHALLKALRDDVIIEIPKVWIDDCAKEEKEEPKKKQKPHPNPYTRKYKKERR